MEHAEINEFVSISGSLKSAVADDIDALFPRFPVTSEDAQRRAFSDPLSAFQDKHEVVNPVYDHYYYIMG
jgi:hypothetical protein